MKLRPLSDRIILRKAEVELKTPGGLVIPGTAAEEKLQGEVIAVGPGRWSERGERLPIEVKAGDRVQYTYLPNGWHDIELAGEKFRVIRQENVVGVLE